jgi:hypothetical protein
MAAMTVRSILNNDAFQTLFFLAIGLGLTVEEKTVESASGGNGGSANSALEKLTSSSGSSKTTTTTYAELCFDPILARQAQAEMTEAGNDFRRNEANLVDFKGITFSPQCGGNWDPRKTSKEPQPDYFPFRVNGILFKTRPRSAYGMFKFLGQLIRDQQEKNDPSRSNSVTAYLPKGRENEPAEQPKLLTVGHDQNLVEVVRDTANVSCFVHTWFEDADYCVSDKAETTKTIVSLLAQLIAIQTSATDLSITPLVRIAQ